MYKTVSHINIRKTHLFIAVAFLFTVSCKDDQNEYIPTVPNFSIELDINTDLAPLGAGQLVTITPNKSQPDYSDLNYQSSKFHTITIPFKCYGNGLVLIKGFDNEYKVFDLTCPYNAFTDYKAVTFKSNDIAENCTCPGCQSEFVLYNSGVPTNNSKATKPLLQYKISIISYNSRMLISK